MDRHTIDVEDVVVEGLPHRVGSHTAVGSVVGLVQVFDVKVTTGDDGMGWHVVIHLQPVHPLWPKKKRKSQSTSKTSWIR